MIFADDSNIFISGNEPDKLVTSMNEEMTKIIEWLYKDEQTIAEYWKDTFHDV